MTRVGFTPGNDDLTMKKRGCVSRKKKHDFTSKDYASTRKGDLNQHEELTLGIFNMTRSAADPWVPPTMVVLTSQGYSD